MRMKDGRIVRVLAVFLLFFQIAMSAAAQANRYCSSEYLILFGNGVNTIFPDWVQSVQALRDIAEDSHNEVPVNYGLAENPSDGVLLDLYQVYQQKVSEDPSLSWELLIRVFAGAVDGLTFGTISKVQALITDTAAASSQQLQAKFQAQYNYTDADVVAQKALVIDGLKNQGNRVLLVAHSQGNLYANAVHRAVYNDPDVTPGSFSLVAVATPANFVPQGVPYTTSDNDVVINSLRQLISSNVLAANVSVPFRFDDVSGHFFTGTYLNASYAARAKISTDIFASMDKLVRPEDTYEYEVRAMLVGAGSADPIFGPLPTGVFNSLINAFDQINPGLRDRVMSSPLDSVNMWSVRDSSKRKLDPYYAGDAQLAQVATSEVKRRLAVFRPNANVSGSALAVFLSGKGPYYNACYSYASPPTWPVATLTPMGYDLSGPTLPLDISFSGAWNCGSPKYPYGSIRLPGEVFRDFYMQPVLDELKQIPKEVAQLELTPNSISLKICRQPMI
ncbi:hypothetical protein [Cupriavidus sp. USMAA2-4]|uniref:hypothetical protein n=1 Tax=Cupriavidus sp. USMAA2-4 TaxID=876364 RepID=UPI0012F4B97B|nr:hypothetical protein [Cupriavidus sp. USMAA2-4]